MHKKIVVLAIFCFLYHISISLYGQNLTTHFKKVNITQSWEPGPNTEYLYKITKHRLTIFEIAPMFQKLTEKNRLYSKRFNRKLTDSLNILINSIDLAHFESYNFGGAIDGTMIIFQMESKTYNRQITFQNCSSPGFEALLTFINRQIPTRRRYIAFYIWGK